MNHRRPSNDELTPEDLFRPEPSPGATPGHGMPWDSPGTQQPEYFEDPAPHYPQQPVEEASTQFMPPFPAAPQPQQPQAQPQPQPAYGYQPQPQPGYGYQAPPPPPPVPPQAPSRSGRFSPMTIGIAVVAGCAVLGIGVAAAMSGGGGGSAAASGGSASASATASQTAGGSSGNGVDPAEQAQAKALSDLLATASNSRAAVVSAVGGIENCRNLDGAAQDLANAAGLRGQLVQQLSTLQTDKLPEGAALVAALKEGWEASRSADTHYAAWAKASKGSCDKKHQPKGGDQKRAGDSASSTATIAKQKASRLWNAIATPTGLPKRAGIQL